MLLGAARRDDARARRDVRGRLRGRGRRGRPRRRGERDPPTGRPRRPADARGAARVGQRARLGGGAGLPGALSGAAPARRDDALLRRGVVPEVHAVPDRQPRAPRDRGRRGDDVRARRSRSGWRRWRRPRSAGSARRRRFPGGTSSATGRRRSRDRRCPASAADDCRRGEGGLPAQSGPDRENLPCGSSRPRPPSRPRSRVVRRRAAVPRGWKTVWVDGTPRPGVSPATVAEIGKLETRCLAP